MTAYGSGFWSTRSIGALVGLPSILKWIACSQLRSTLRSRHSLLLRVNLRGCTVHQLFVTLFVRKYLLCFNLRMRLNLRLISFVISFADTDGRFIYHHVTKLHTTGCKIFWKRNLFCQSEKAHARWKMNFPRNSLKLSEPWVMKQFFASHRARIKTDHKFSV